MSGALAAPSSPLVDVDWLQSQQGHPDLVVLDARVEVRATGANTVYSSGRASFEADGHIPGARFADLFAEFSDPAARFPFTRPQAEPFKAVLQRLGIRTDSVIVVYDSSSGAWAARAWWLLRAYGHPQVRVLNGGLTAWIAAGGTLEHGAAALPSQGDFVPVPLAGFFVDTPEVLAALGTPAEIRLVCATRSSEFTGAKSEPRSGHIPGSFSVPYRELLDDLGRLRLERVHREAARLGLAREGTILYCGGGVNATGVALGLLAAGYPAPRIYDGSLNEWKADPRLPLERGPERS